MTVKIAGISIQSFHWLFNNNFRQQTPNRVLLATVLLNNFRCVVDVFEICLHSIHLVCLTLVNALNKLHFPSQHILTMKFFLIRFIWNRAKIRLITFIKHITSCNATIWKRRLLEILSHVRTGCDQQLRVVNISLCNTKSHSRKVICFCVYIIYSPPPSPTTVKFCC